MATRSKYGQASIAGAPSIAGAEKKIVTKNIYLN